jgi:hypothetical protein
MPKFQACLQKTVGARDRRAARIAPDQMPQRGANRIATTMNVITSSRPPALNTTPNAYE